MLYYPTKVTKRSKFCPDCGIRILKPCRDKRCRPCNNKARILPLEVRFWKYVKKTSTCWLWTGGLSSGYGTFFIKQDKKRNHAIFDGAHRISWKMRFGQIPKGLFILHKCSNPPCVNPDHLYAGTPADNSADMVRQNRQKKGKELAHTKLTESQVQEIRRLYIPNKFGYWKLGKMFNVVPETISFIVKRKTWKHI